MAFDSYAALTTAISDWMDRSDLTGSAPSMIALAESRMRRKLDPLFDETIVTVNTTTGVGTLPADVGTINRVTYNYYDLPRWSGFSMAELNDANYSTDPFAYTVEANAIRVWPPVSVALTVYYQPTITALSDTNTTNTVLAKHPDVYFYGAMMFAEGYVANDDRAALFKQLYDEALEEAATYFSRQRYTGHLVPKIKREW